MNGCFTASPSCPAHSWRASAASRMPALMTVMMALPIIRTPRHLSKAIRRLATRGGYALWVNIQYVVQSFRATDASPLHRSAEALWKDVHRCL